MTSLFDRRLGDGAQCFSNAGENAYKRYLVLPYFCILHLIHRIHALLPTFTNHHQTQIYFTMSDMGRQSLGDKAGAALKPDSQNKSPPV